MHSSLLRSAPSCIIRQFHHVLGHHQFSEFHQIMRNASYVTSMPSASDLAGLLRRELHERWLLRPRRWAKCQADVLRKESTAMFKLLLR